MKKSIWILFIGLMILSQLEGQNSDSETDTLLKLAQTEYEQKKFKKTRELCELALSKNPNLGEAHNLIGKAYISSSDLCNEKDKISHHVKEEIIWAAMDEWEIGISKPNKNKDEALILIERYSNYLPTKEHFKTCFTSSTLKEGDEYYVECWIQRKTKVRFKSED